MTPVANLVYYKHCGARGACPRYGLKGVLRIRIELMQPILRPTELEAFKLMDLRGFASRVIDATWPAVEGPAGLEDALSRICREASSAIDAGYEFIVLSDRATGLYVIQLAPHVLLLHNLFSCHLSTWDGSSWTSRFLDRSGEIPNTTSVCCP